MSTARVGGHTGEYSGVGREMDTALESLRSRRSRPSRRGRDEALSAPPRFWIALYSQESIVIMEACKLSSTRWVALTACAGLPTPGTVA